MDKFLIVNVFLIIAGFIFFLVAAISSSFGYVAAYEFFQKLWFPLFIPVISTFFTAIFIQNILGKFVNILREYIKK